MYGLRKPAYLQSGQIELLVLIAIVILFAFFASGGLFPKKESSIIVEPNTLSADSCCDNGDGPNCTLVEGRRLTWRGHEYGLLKSDIGFTEGVTHFGPALPDDRASTGERVFLNDTQRINHSDQSECPLGNDLLWKNVVNRRCTGIEDDAVIYICEGSCEGTVGTGRFHAYYRTDLQIPDVIANCDKSQAANGIFSNPDVGQVAKTLVCPEGAPAGEQLQLEACKIVKAKVSVPWLSPYCKPAIYLYPEEKTDVSVAVAPKGKLTLAIPSYPKEGWNVTAFPDGQIDSQNTTYDYLYYEAAIPDNVIEKPKEGFIVTHRELPTLFTNILPKLGLNEKESSQFSEYWLKALPKSAYYFVGVVPTSNLNVIAPLTINPPPTTTIRVTLYFQALDEKISVNAPTIITPSRNGFTAVEWGGIVKTDPNHPFSCLM